MTLYKNSKIFNKDNGRQVQLGHLFCGSSLVLFSKYIFFSYFSDPWFCTASFLSYVICEFSTLHFVSPPLLHQVPGRLALGAYRHRKKIGRGPGFARSHDATSSLTGTRLRKRLMAGLCRGRRSARRRAALAAAKVRATVARAAGASQGPTALRYTDG